MKQYLLCLVFLGWLGCEGRIDPGLFQFADLSEGSAVEGELAVELGPGFNTLKHGVGFLANGTFIDQDRVRPYQTRLDTRALPEGDLTLAVIDLAEASADPSVPPQPPQPVASIRLIVDNQGPEITLAQPKGIPCVRSGDRLTISIQASDHVGVKNVDFRIAAESIAHFTSLPYEHTLVLSAAHFTGPNAKPTCLITIGAENQRGLISNQTTELARCSD